MHGHFGCCCCIIVFKLVAAAVLWLYFGAANFKSWKRIGFLQRIGLMVTKIFLPVLKFSLDAKTFFSHFFFFS